MSRHFEILERADKGDLLTPAGSPPAVTSLGGRSSERASTMEEISKLVQRLFFLGDAAGRPGVVAFSGIKRDDRSSLICVLAAECLAQQAGTSVCVVEANFRSPQLHTHFDVGNLTGLAVALAEEGPIRRFATPLPKNLWLIPSSAIKQGSDINVERFRERVEELRREFDYVLLSGPPMIRETEASLTGRVSDGIVLIVEANRTSRKDLRQAKEQLAKAEVKLLGAVLDQRKFPVPDFLYRKL
jgi:Mrp family chromosome partitioning ATPase